MSSQCTNCNIQNSSSEYQGSQGEIGIKILPPRKRYNPAVFNASASKGSSILSSAVSAVASQTTAVGSLEEQLAKQREKMKSTVSKLNTDTLLALEKAQSLRDIETQIQSVSDVEKRAKQKSQDSQNNLSLKMQPMARVVAKRSILSSNVKSDIPTVQNIKAEKKYKRYLYPKSVGTSLASSALYKAQFANLNPIKISPIVSPVDLKIPNEFNGVEIWKNYIHPIRNQGLCGSCWAFSSLFVLAARLSIYSKGFYNYTFSPAKLVLCNTSLIKDTDQTKDEITLLKDRLQDTNPFDYNDKTNTKAMTCQGETLIGAWQYLFRYGVTENDCILYGDEKNRKKQFDFTRVDSVDQTCSNVLGSDFDICPSGEIAVNHRAGGYYSVPGTKNDNIALSGSEYDIRREIYRWGPVTSGMIVYQDFIDWDGLNIYQYDKKSEKVGGHAIVIMGWGEENNVKYWIARNSWGVEWGQKGYFKILRGENHCEIEENVFVGIPNIPSIRLFLEHPLYYTKEDYFYKNLWNIYDNGVKLTSLEKLSLAKLKPTKNIFKSIYDISRFPNFLNYYSGEVKESFNVKKKKKKYSFIFFLCIFILLILIF